MRLAQIQLKHIFCKDQIVFFGRIDKLASKEFLKLKKKLLKKNIDIKHVPNKDLKRFFYNFKNEKFFNLLKGDIVLLLSESLNWYQFYDICKLYFSEINFFLVSAFSRFFFVSNLLSRVENQDIFFFLRKRLLNNILKKLIVSNNLLMSILNIQFFHFLRIIIKLIYGK